VKGPWNEDLWNRNGEDYGSHCVTYMDERGFPVAHQANDELELY